MRLLNYPHWQTHDPDEAVVSLSREHRRLRQEIASGKGYLLSANTVELERLVFTSIRISSRDKAWAESDGRYYMLAFWNEGGIDYRSNGRAGTVGPGEGLLSSPYGDSFWRSSGERDLIAVRIPSQMLLEETEHLAGRLLGDPLESRGVLKKQGPIWRLLNSFLNLLENGFYLKPSMLRHERQKQLVTDLILGTPHNVPLREEREHNSPSFHRRRSDLAKQYIEAHLTDPITIGDLAEAAGASTKGLQRAFHYMQENWRELRREMRLHAARRDLLAPEEATTVSFVAEKYGFHPGRFGAEYFELFGEYPHETLQLGRLGRRVF